MRSPFYASLLVYYIDEFEATSEHIVKFITIIRNARSLCHRLTPLTQQKSNNKTLVINAHFYFHSIVQLQLNLYLGLAVMSGFVLFDTQMIMEKHRMGSNDCIAHSLDLFYDVISIFRRLLIILTQKEQNNERKKKKN